MAKANQELKVIIKKQQNPKTAISKGTQKGKKKKKNCREIEGLQGVGMVDISFEGFERSSQG